jgi:hypothetical protein
METLSSIRSPTKGKKTTPQLFSEVITSHLCFFINLYITCLFSPTSEIELVLVR